MALNYSAAFVRRCPTHIAALIHRCIAEEDKRLHMKWSFWLTVGAYVLWPPIGALTLVFLIGLAKECRDHLYGTGFCLLDMACNLVGIAAGAALGSMVMLGALT